MLVYFNIDDLNLYYTKHVKRRHNMQIYNLNSKNIRVRVIDARQAEEDCLFEIIITKNCLRKMCIELIRHERANKCIELTKREKQVLNYLSQGKSNFETAELMHISVHTVKDHIHNILEKLCAGGRTDAVVKAIKQGVIDI